MEGIIVKPVILKSIVNSTLKLADELENFYAFVYSGVNMISSDSNPL